ncbi:MAG: alpha/beta fold hydrolase [Prolixibacteraceae bacterium]|jgi:cephalosporin-C deacetylase-like acetyl esterase|nr:alpha/beta fold hydrolase [Prolixibacteraceae bacterium]
MKKTSITFFAVCFILLGSLLVGLPFENSLLEAMSNKGNKRGTSFSDTKSGQANRRPIVLNDSENFEDIEIKDFDGKVDKLVKPVSLKIFETTNEQLMGRRVFTDFVRTHIDSLEEKRKLELDGLKNPAEWSARQKNIREGLYKFLGEFPERTPLNARTVGKLDRENYTIEKIIFESQPRYYVTANLYIPKDRKFPLPGVVLTCGHSNDAKAYDEYQMTCLGLASKGYVVLIFDPMGQGERSEYFDAGTKNPLVPMSVSQHHYVGRPAFLVDWTLSGLRTWDAVRAVDYLVSRPEVDKNKLASVGQSGGGQMALLLTAVDERIKVCAASHPGGSMEYTYLLGQRLADREILSLIPPRPLRIIVGSESGEEPYHRQRIEDMQLFYEGLGAGKQCGNMDVVPGIHSMKRPNRESVYEWLNKWLDKEVEGKAEAMIEPEKIETLRCTDSGNTIISLGSETGQNINEKRADKIYKPEMDLTKLKERIAKRIGLAIPENASVPVAHSFGTILYEDITIEKLTYESEKGIVIPTLLIKPKNVKPGSPVYIYASDKGKPDKIDDSILPFILAKNGYTVLAIDVRGIGETSPTPPLGLDQFTGYTPSLWKHDVLAIESASFGRTTLGMRTFDVIRGIDLLHSRDDFKGRKIIVVGEGLGGLWALLASVYDSRINGVVTIGTLPSYKLLITNHYYNVWGYFWVPGALHDFDIPDLTRLISPKPQIWINPVNEMGNKLNILSASSITGSNKYLHIITLGNDSIGKVLKQFNRIFN